MSVGSPDRRQVQDSFVPCLAPVKPGAVPGRGSESAVSVLRSQIKMHLLNQELALGPCLATRTPRRVIEGGKVGRRVH